jgi:hypothetical protein
VSALPSPRGISGRLDRGRFPFCLNPVLGSQSDVPRPMRSRVRSATCSGPRALKEDEFQALSRDFLVAARAVSLACSPDHMNYASLGNVVPHVHWHIVPRYRSDPRWGAPIYMTAQEDMPETRISSHEYEATVEAIRSALADLAR